MAWRSPRPGNFEPLTLCSVKGSKFQGLEDRQADSLTVPPTWKLWTSTTAASRYGTPMPEIQIGELGTSLHDSCQPFIWMAGSCHGEMCYLDLRHWCTIPYRDAAVVEVQSFQVRGTVKLSAWRSSWPENFEPLQLQQLYGKLMPDVPSSPIWF